MLLFMLDNDPEFLIFMSCNHHRVSRWPPPPWKTFWEGSCIAEELTVGLLDRYKTPIEYAVVLEDQDFLVYNIVELYLFFTKLYENVFLKNVIKAAESKSCGSGGFPDGLNLALSVLQDPMKI